jgi:hypothetical protein
MTCSMPHRRWSVLELFPPLEELSACTVPEQQLGPVQVERDGGDRRGHLLRAQRREGPLCALDLVGGVVSAVVDQLRIGAGREGRSSGCAARAFSRCSMAPDQEPPIQLMSPRRSSASARRQAALAPAASLASFLALSTSPAARSALASPSPRRVRSSSWCCGVNRFAAEKSSAAASGAPRRAAKAAPASSSAAVSSSGSVVQSARWRARYSGSDTTSARRLCSCRRRSAETEP